MQSPIFHFNDAKRALVDEVTARVCEETNDPLFSLNDAAYHELRRLAGTGEDVDWRALGRTLGKMSEGELRERLRGIVRSYAEDVAGNFDRRVYDLVSKAGAPVLGALLSPRSTFRNVSHMFELEALDNRIVVQGPTQHIRRLAHHGTLIFVPTHLSNLDSIVFGFAIERAGLPPATYGAGKNLFTNPVLSYFMRNLGAYRLDRRVKHALYKEVLKAYSAVLIEHGYHSLFFPGGTRSRSGGVERRLKLGLIGTGVEAFVRSTLRGKTQPVFFVPATINYLLTLEAETLIDDFLQEEGKGRYIIEDDESTRVGRIAAFAKKLLGLDASVIVRFSSPIDCFGNRVDDEGHSHDARGRTIDPRSYIMDPNDEPTFNAARDAQYTRELGDEICAAYRRDTVIMPTHVVAKVAFDFLKQSVGKGDLYAWLRHNDDVTISRGKLAENVEVFLAEARAAEGRGEIVIAPSLRNVDGFTVVGEALRAFDGFHTQEVLRARGGDLVLADTRLLFYYQNRIAAHGLAIDLIAPRAHAPVT